MKKIFLTFFFFKNTLKKMASKIITSYKYLTLRNLTNSFTLRMESFLMLPFHRVGKHSVLCEGSKAGYRIEHHQFHVAFFFANGFLGISPRQLLLLGRNKRKKWDKNGKNALLYDIHGKEFQGIFFLTLSHLLDLLKLDRK